MAANLAFHHGTAINEKNSSPVIVETAQSAVIGILGTAANADPTVFPLDTPVLFLGASNLNLADKLGAEGTLYDSLMAAFAQCATYVYVVRVAEGTTYNQTLSNLIGSQSAKTGMFAFTKCAQLFGPNLTPRIIVAPGFTGSLSTDGVSAVNMTTDGGAYSASTTVTVTGGGGQGVVLAPIVGGESNGITGVEIINPGWGFTSAPTVVFTDPASTGSGAVATATVGTVANPVTENLPTLLNLLGAVAFVDGPNTTDDAAVTFRGTIESPRIMVCDGYVEVWSETDSAYEPKPSSPYWAGVTAATDLARGFWWSPSNKTINGIGGTVRPIAYGPETDYLNGNQVSTIINRGSGYKTWGNRGATSDTSWAFLSVRRTADMINAALLKYFLEYNDIPFSKANLLLIQESGNDYLATLAANGAILQGSKVWIDPTLNTPSTWAAGKLYLSVKFQPPAPIEDIEINTYLDPSEYQLLIDSVAQTVSVGALSVSAAPGTSLGA